jgi:SAM-dependent methyltransferase
MESHPNSFPEAAAVLESANADEMRFGFGANWADYVKQHFSDERVGIAQRHLLHVLKLPNLQGKTFLDIGCGSGLHSLAASRAGAETLTSFDYDPQAVATTRQLHDLSGCPARWTVMQGSVLDDTFVRSLPKCDIVYSWGVLHHTGNMWKALANAARCLHESSVFYIALYSSDVFTNPPASHWLAVKREYNQASRVKRRWMELCYAWDNSIRNDLRNRRNPLTCIRQYKRSRGMSYWHDVRDWLGGYPMEFAGHRETLAFCRDQDLEILHLRAGEANTEYVFRRRGATNYWDDIVKGAPLLDMPRPFTHVDGFAWRAQLPNVDLGNPETFMLYEDGVPVGWPKQQPHMIAAWGQGRYVVEDGAVQFSATDNSNPGQSGRRYQFRTNFY